MLQPQKREQSSRTPKWPVLYKHKGMPRNAKPEERKNLFGPALIQIQS